MSGGSYALGMVAICLTLSAAARTGDLAVVGDAQDAEISMSSAAEAPPEMASLVAERDQVAAAKPDDAPKNPKSASGKKPEDPDADAILSMLRQRQSQLEARERKVADRERELEAVEEKLRAELDLLREAEARLARTLAQTDEAAEKDIAHLVGVYQAMKPKAAAQIFNSMEVGFAAGFLSRMLSEPAAEILAAMDTDAAYAVSVVMAGRNAAAPTE